MVTKVKKLPEVEEKRTSVHDAAPGMPKIYKSISQEKIVLTPQKATRFLENAVFENRDVKQPLVNRIAADIKDGRWRVNGETIVLDCYGRLLDGQHRCWAVVEADVPVQICAVFGVEPDAFTTIDTGDSRSPVDLMSMLGEKNKTVLASILRWEWLRREGYLDGRGNAGKVRPTNTQYQEILGEDPETFRLAAQIAAGKHGKRVKIFPPSPLGYVWYLAQKKSREQADRFLEDCHIGANLPADDPVFRLRTLFQDSRMRGRRFTQTEALALIVKAWNLRRMNRKVKTLSWRTGENMPKIE